MLIKADESALLVVDMQGRLLTLVQDWQRILDNVMWLTRVARKIGVPVMATEQYPKGLGRTQPDLAALIPPAASPKRNTSPASRPTACRGCPGPSGARWWSAASNPMFA
ncbi:isochorismatase family protein [Sulfurisoma sediminicola]|uniref:isochorismatase family protein n=1 Tax=Sulfurisoma sediminicola TaxID=1381557 RepID=UPI0023BA150F|nr:isochorismatase family protein [Sulfurisoma sediminicola]